MFGYTSSESPLHQNKEKRSYKHMSGNELFLILLKNHVQQQIHLICNILLTTDIMHLQCTFPVELLPFIKSQFTEDAENILRNWISARMDTLCHGLSHSFKGPGAVENDLTGKKKKCVTGVSLHVKLEQNTVGFSNVLTGKSLKDWGQQVVRLYLKN